MSQLNIVWFRYDLRLDDNPALIEAAKQKIPFLAISIFPTKTTIVDGLSSISDARANAIHQALESLHASLEAKGIGLLIVQTVQDLRSFINPSDIHTVFYNDYPGTTEQHQLNLLQKQFNQSIFHANKSYSMIHPHQLGFSINELPDVFTNFRKQIEKNIIITPPSNEPKFLKTDIRYSLPSLKSLGFQETLLLIPSGEEYSLERLRYYCIDSSHVRTYKETRNGMLEWDDSSKLSMHLSLGTLSARRVYATLKESESLYGANESTYWLWFELLWRDFFYFTHLKEQQSFFQPWDLPERLSPLQLERFSAILNATTGYPLVDANMKELVKTGWMSNRGRQNVASFFVHYCKLPWSLGATMFETYLLDYNVSSNIGNWRYVAGVGNDPREHRIFNVMKQGTQYDASTHYILRWLPQLSALPIHQRYFVNQLSNHQRTLIDYPHPIVGLPWQ
jgi:deoxyribodipyrimidine photo-lyase